MISGLWQDLRYAFRILRKSPVFLAAAVLSIALGIGASTTIFSAFQAVFLGPSPYRDAEQLVEITKISKHVGPPDVNHADVEFWRRTSRSFQSFATYSGFRAMTLSGIDAPVNLLVRLVSPDLFPTLGSRALIGRVLTQEDFRKDSPPVVVIAHSVWQEQFHGDPKVIGRRILLDGMDHTVVGVMPLNFNFPTASQRAWLPDKTPVTDPFTYASTVARLKPGVSEQAALAELERLWPALAKQYPESKRDWRLQMEGIAGRDTKDHRRAFQLLFSAVGFLVLIACLNVANLLLARSSAREEEFSIRSALGAGRRRLIRQVITESLVLALIGGSLGLLLAYAGNRALLAFLPSNFSIPRLDQTQMDSMVLLFALAVTAITGLAFGIIPALALSRHSLRETARSVTSSARKNRGRSILIVSEIGLSLILLVGAGLLIRSFVRLLDVDPGFRAEHVLTAWIPASFPVEKDKDQLFQRYAETLRMAEAQPGVTTAAIATAVPMGNVNVTVRTFLPGADGETGFRFAAVSPNYFAAMGVPLKRGRAFTPADIKTTSDTKNMPMVAIINESAARKYWPNQNPIGKKLGNTGPTGVSNITIVGVVGDIHHQTLSGKPVPELYHPYTQYLGPAIGATLVLRTHGDASLMIPALRRSIHELSPGQPIQDISTMQARVEKTVAQPRLYMTLLAFFAALAVILTVIGIYGVMSYSVSQRTREMGIRMALGAERWDVLSTVLGQGLRLVLLGVAVGIAGAWALTQFMTSLIFGITPRDPLTFALAPALLTTAALIACYFPARRATKVDPSTALRQE